LDLYKQIRYPEDPKKIHFLKVHAPHLPLILADENAFENSLKLENEEKLIREIYFLSSPLKKCVFGDYLAWVSFSLKQMHTKVGQN
jgi:hypothetical protein